jgi:hypothetical protein
VGQLFACYFVVAPAVSVLCKQGVGSGRGVQSGPLCGCLDGRLCASVEDETKDFNRKLSSVPSGHTVLERRDSVTHHGSRQERRHKKEKRVDPRGRGGTE